MKTTLILLTIAMLALGSVELPAVGGSTSAGKEFVVCFPHPSLDSKDAKSHAQLFISSANGNLCHVNINYTLKNKVVDIKDTILVDNVLTVEFPAEMKVVEYLKNEKKGIFVTSDNNINVYGIARVPYTSDAFLCYPNHVLDTSYIVTSHDNALGTLVGDPRAKYSNLNIVATEDDTEVTIYPTAPLQGWGNYQPEKVTIMMNKGETRQIIARITRKYDLTGSIVTANKKIAVYSTHQGHKGAPFGMGNTDVLIEQTLPISRLATNTIFSPSYNIPMQSHSFGRIVSPFENNHVKFSDTTIILNKQEFYEFEYDTCLYVETSKPALFAMYCSSVASGGGAVGPYLVLLPPVENYQNRYLSVSPKFAYTVREQNKFYHLLNFIISEEGLKTLTIAGQPVTDTTYVPIYGTDYVYLWKWVGEGAHVIESDSAFGLITHGWALADSYGYIPGMKTDRKIDFVFDKSPPVSYFDNACIGTLLIAEEGDYKTGIAGMELIEIDNMKYYKDVSYVDEYSMRYFCELLDPLRDGFMKYEVSDVAGNTRIDSLLLKGFTMAGTPPERDTIYFNALVCGEIDLENIGSFEQEFESYFAENVVFSVPQSVSQMKVTNGSRTTQIYCMSSLQLGTMRDTLLLVDSCGRVVRLPFEVEVLPNAYAATSRCDVPLRAVTSEQHRISYEDGTLSLANFDGEISIYNLLGEQLFRRHYSNATQTEQLDLRAGVYFLVAIDADGKHTFMKVMGE